MFATEPWSLPPHDPWQSAPGGPCAIGHGRVLCRIRWQRM